MVVGHKASGRQRGEREESRVSRARKGWGRDCEEPKIRGEGFGPGKEGVGGVGGIEKGDRGGVEKGVPIGAQEGGNTDEGMGQGRVGEKIARDRGGFEGKRELACDVGGAPDRQRRAIG